MRPFILVLIPFLASCAVLHRHQLGEINSKVVREGLRFEVLVSELGVDIQEAASIGQAMTKHQGTKDTIGDIAAIIGLFQMGPRTGNPVYNDKFADNLSDAIMKQCPGGVVSGLSVSRETAKYPVVSGEIVRIVGYCYQKKGA